MMLVCMLGGTAFSASAQITDVNMSIQAPTTIQEGETSITATIMLGKLAPDGLTGDISVPMGYEADVQYDTNIVESITAKGLNGWSCQIANNRIVADTNTVSANTKVAELTIKLKAGVPAGTKVDVQFKNFNISDGASLDKTISLAVGTTIEAKVANSDTTPANDTNNTITNTTTTTDTEKQNATNSTVKSGNLPKAGETSGLITAIVVLGVIAILGIIRYHSIKVK